MPNSTSLPNIQSFCARAGGTCMEIPLHWRPIIRAPKTTLRAASAVKALQMTVPWLRSVWDWLDHRALTRTLVFSTSSHTMPQSKKRRKRLQTLHSRLHPKDKYHSPSQRSPSWTQDLLHRPSSQFLTIPHSNPGPTAVARTPKVAFRTVRLGNPVRSRLLLPGRLNACLNLVSRT